jgi:NCAIR mutase (PurE)-related protein
MSDRLPAPFDDLRAALAEAGAGGPDRDAPERPFRPDPGRGNRTGVPEVVHAERKRAEEVVAALQALADATGRAVASRCPSETAILVRERLGDGYEVTAHERARAVVVATPGAALVPTGGRVGVLSAGTSDLPIAAEAALMAREMGAGVEEVWDVGVAGLHRLVVPLERMVADGVDAIVVAAGMDGALPSVVAGLVAVPVIGLPTSVGYGFGGGGVGALTTMLQSCAPGLSVVNVDNGIGAGATAALIANRVAAARHWRVPGKLPVAEAREEVGDGGGGRGATSGDGVDRARELGKMVGRDREQPIELGPEAIEDLPLGRRA